MRKRRILAWLMAMVMAIGLMPATALAKDDEHDSSGAIHDVDKDFVSAVIGGQEFTKEKDLENLEVTCGVDTVTYKITIDGFKFTPNNPWFNVNVKDEKFPSNIQAMQITAKDGVAVSDKKLDSNGLTFKVSKLNKQEISEYANKWYVGKVEIVYTYTIQREDLKWDQKDREYELENKVCVNVDKKTWEDDEDIDFKGIKEESQVPTEPTKPTKPTELNVGLQIVCTDEAHSHSVGKFDYRIGDVEGNFQNGYYVVVTLKSLDNPDDLSCYYPEGHVKDENMNDVTNLTFTWDGKKWVCPASPANFVLHVKPVTQVPTPPTAVEVNLNVVCENADHNDQNCNSQYNNLDATEYEITGSAENGYKVKLKEPNEYVPDKHERTNQGDVLTLALRYDEVNAKWVADDNATFILNVKPKTDGSHDTEFHTMFMDAIRNKIRDAENLPDDTDVDVKRVYVHGDKQVQIGDTQTWTQRIDRNNKWEHSIPGINGQGNVGKEDWWKTLNTPVPLKSETVDKIEIVARVNGERVVTQVNADHLENVALSGLDSHIAELYLKFDVTFDANGVEITAPNPQIVEFGNKVKDPNIEGVKWYKDAACTEEWDFTTDVVKRNTTLYAGVDNPNPPVEETKKIVVNFALLQVGDSWEDDVEASYPHTFTLWSDTASAECTAPGVVAPEGKEFVKWEGNLENRSLDDGASFCYDDFKDFVSFNYIDPTDGMPTGYISFSPVYKDAEVPEKERFVNVTFNVDPDKGEFTDPAGAEYVTFNNIPEFSDQQFDVPKVAAKDGYVFTGWKVEGKETGYWDAEAVTFGITGLAHFPEGSDVGYITVTAQFEREQTEETEEITVHFYISDEEAGDYIIDGKEVKNHDETVGVKDKVTFPELKYDTSKYELTGWQVDGRYSVVWDAEAFEMLVEGLDNNGHISVTPLFKLKNTPSAKIDIEKKLVEVDGKDYNGKKVSKGDELTYYITVDNFAGDKTAEDIVVKENPKNLKNGEFIGIIEDGDLVKFNKNDEIKTEDDIVITKVNDDEVMIDELPKGTSVVLVYEGTVSSSGKDVVNKVTAEEDGGSYASDELTTGVKDSTGGIPSKNRPTKPSKVDEVLNTEDHFQYVQGYPDNTVGPERNITRAEATVIFFRLLNDSVRTKYLDAENAFSDVNMNDWFNLGVSTMENGGFVSGYDDGLFRPNAYITRAELATIISNFDDLEPAAENKFADVEGHWAEKYINSAAEKGWLSGYEDGLFRPNQYITRAETMSMINRVLDRRVDADGLHAAAKQWKDNPESKWYYYAVLEATNYHEYEREDVSDYENWTAIKAEKIWEN